MRTRSSGKRSRVGEHPTSLASRGQGLTLVTLQVTLGEMIVSFRHRGLDRLYSRGDVRRLNPNHLSRIRAIISLLDLAREPKDMDVSGLYLHRLRGSQDGIWSVRVSANWRITFGFDGYDVCDVDLVDYH